MENVKKEKTIMIKANKKKRIRKIGKKERNKED